MKKIIIAVLFSLSLLLPVFAAEQGIKSDLKAQYLKERITFVTKEEFDVIYPLNVRIFTFYQGDKKMSFDEFITLSQDPILLRNQKKVNAVKAAGFTTAGIFGFMTVATLIPSVIFITKQTNNSQVDQTYVISGVVMFAISLASFAGMFIDLITTFSLLYNYKYSAQAVRLAVDNYNEKIMKRLGIIPDMSFNNRELNFTLTYKY